MVRKPTRAKAWQPRRNPLKHRPTTDTSVLGRVVAVLGAPQGVKAEHATSELLAYLSDAPAQVRREFVDVYLQNRGHQHNDKLTVPVREDRPEGYLDALASLIRDVSTRMNSHARRPSPITMFSACPCRLASTASISSSSRSSANSIAVLPTAASRTVATSMSHSWGAPSTVLDFPT